MHPYYLEPRDLRNSVQHMVNERISNNKKTVLGVSLDIEGSAYITLIRESTDGL